MRALFRAVSAVIAVLGAIELCQGAPAAVRFMAHIGIGHPKLLGIVLTTLVMLVAVCLFAGPERVRRVFEALRGSDARLLVAASASAERVRQHDIVRRLGQEYLQTHNNVPLQIRLATEPLPKEWVERRLEEMGETWRWDRYLI